MPVLEFALDASALSRVQVHISTHQGPVSVMLNRNVIGSLTTLEEQISGKDFRLPDNSILRVQILNGHPRVWRNGRTLALASASETHSLPEGETHGRMGSGVVALLLLNILAFGGLCLWFLVAAIVAMSSPETPLPFLLSSFLTLLGLVGIFALLGWRRWGLYLAICAMAANFAPAILFGIVDYRTFLPLVSLALLVFALSSSGVWHKMR